MQKDEAIKKIVNEQAMKKIIFGRTMSSSSMAHYAMNMLNEEIEKNESIRSTAIALSTYMPMKWALENKIVYSLTYDHGDSFISEMVDVNNLMQRFLGNEPDKKLIDVSYIGKQHEYIREVHELIDRSLLMLKKNPPMFGGLSLYRCINTIHIDPEAGLIDDVSRYTVRNYYLKAVREISDLYGKKMDYYFSRALYTPKSYLQENDDKYHNTDLLMTAYIKLLSRYVHDESLYRKVLRCKTVEEIATYDKYVYADYEHAEQMLQYMIYIRSAIEIVKEFPVDGKLYYDLLLGEIDTKVQGKALRSLLKSLHLTQASYYRVRREAYDVLSMVLWGYSTRNMLGILQK